MEFVLLKHSKKSNQFISSRSIDQNKPSVETKQQQLTIPKFEIETILSDYKVNAYQKILLVKPSRSDLTITLTRPAENTFLIIKDISGSKKYSTIIELADGLKIDDAEKVQLDQPYESLSLLYTKENDRFLIY